MGAGEVTQQLRMLTALAKDQSEFPAHQIGHSYPNSSSQGPGTLF